MYQYTLAFIIKNDKVLLLNRNKSPWMGSWNGVGGKIEPNETIDDSMIREIKEETGLDLSLDQIEFKGYVTWNSFDAKGQGLYLYICYANEIQDIKTPKVIDEGILDWKQIEWASSKENYGIARNIPYFLNHALSSNKTHEYHCIFEGDELKNVIIKEL